MNTSFDPDFAVEGGWTIFIFEGGLTPEGGSNFEGGLVPPDETMLQLVGFYQISPAKLECEQLVSKPK